MASHQAAYIFIIVWAISAHIALLIALSMRKLRDWDRKFYDVDFIVEIYKYCWYLGPIIMVMGLAKLIWDYKDYDTKEKYMLRKLER